MRRFSGEEEGYIYSRRGNPTFKAAEEIIAALESFQIKNKAARLNDAVGQGNALELKAFLHASGMAALSTLFQSNLKSGDAVLSHFSLYGESHEYLHKVLSQGGVQ